MTRHVLRGFDRERLVALRIAKGYDNPAWLARAAGIGTATLRHWESGRSAPGVDLLARVADTLDVPISDLVIVPEDQRFPSYYRVIAGMTQPQLGQAAATTTTTVGAVERADIKPSDALATRLAVAMGISVKTLREAWERAHSRPPGTPA